MRTVPDRLGELLEKRGSITREQLLRALRNQKVLGGRVGTCLLEIEALSEEQLCAALAEQHGVPCATPEDLRGIPDDVLDLLPAKVAKRCHAVAFHASSTQVKVALIEARNLAFQDEISFVVGRRIRWHVAPELRLIEALEKHYREECPARLAKLLDKMNRSRFLWARESAAAQGGGARSTADQLKWDAQVAGVAKAGSTEGDSASSISVELPHFQHQTLELPILEPPPAAAPVAAAATSATPVASIPEKPSIPPSPAIVPIARAAQAPQPARSTQDPAGAPAAGVTASKSPGKATPAVQRPAQAAPALEEDAVTVVTTGASAAGAPRRSVDETERRLLQPQGRDDVARAVLDFAAGLVPRAVLFVVRKDEVAAWFWEGPGIDPVRLGALRLSLKKPSLFDGLKERGGSFRGALSKLPSHATLGACFVAPPLAQEVLVLPLKVKERLVAGLLLEPRPDGAKGIGASDLADLQRVIAKAEIAFELCIMQSKLRRA